MKFKHSDLATSLLSGLKGIEIGGSAHNPFGLDTLNVDITDEFTMFKQEEQKLCGEMLKVDVVAAGDNLPFEDNSFDFVISSHVIEHFYNPIAALKEWERVAKKYIFIIVPHRERTFDKGKPLTTIADVVYNLENPIENPEYKHWTVWELSNFLELTSYLNLNVIKTQDPDDKVGNGFTIVIEL